MDFFCCLSGSSDDDVIQHSEKPSSTKDNGTLGLNLLEDEGENYQKDLWQLLLAEKTRLLTEASNRRSQKTLNPDITTIRAADITSPNDFLQSLTTLYNKNGYAQRMPRIRELFSDIQPFISAVNTLVQTNVVSALVWGSLCLVFEVGQPDTLRRHIWLC